MDIYGILVEVVKLDPQNRVNSSILAKSQPSHPQSFCGLIVVLDTRTTRSNPRNTEPAFSRYDARVNKKPISINIKPTTDHFKYLRVSIIINIDFRSQIARSYANPNMDNKTTDPNTINAVGTNQ